MWEKFKKSAFAEKCRELSKNRSAVILTVCLLLATAVILSVTIATNRAKKKYGADEDATNQQVETPTVNGGEQGTVDSPTYNGSENNKPGDNDSQTGGDAEEFEISLPVSGALAKGHDSSLQVWSDTMGDYRIHLGIDISSAENAPVYAAADGKVSKIWDDALMGRCVAIEHEGDIYTVYKNLSDTMAQGILTGAEVKCGQQIGHVGETAISELADEPHVHFEMTVGGLAVNPLDYMSEETKETLKIDDSTETNTQNPENVTDGK